MDLRTSAIVLDNGEVMWPRELGPAVIDAISNSGRIVLGLDLRSDGDGEPAPGLDTEVPLFDNKGAALDQSQMAAHEALDPSLLPEYRWVLVTWD